MQLFIEPIDVLLFRDGRPFSAGESHRARSVFPPTPNTIQGIIRSQVLAQRCGRYQQYRDRCLNCPEEGECSISDEIGQPANLKTNQPGDLGEMQLKGPLVAKYQHNQLETYFFLPRDIVQVKATAKLKLLQPLDKSLPGSNNAPSQLLPLWTANTVENLDGYLTGQQLQQYLWGKCPEAITEGDELYQRESRLGIEINNAKKITEEGKLYQTEFIRCKPQVGLYVEIEGIKQLSANPHTTEGLVAVGGENRVASYQQLSKRVDLLQLKEALKKRLNQAFKLYLATPTVFKKGWLPGWIDITTLKGEYKGVEVKLKAAAIDKYQTIGGWDVAHNRPKPTYRAVPAGSVYYFTTNASPEEIINAFHWQNLADEAQDRQIGYGLSLVGTWHYSKLS